VITVANTSNTEIIERACHIDSLLAGQQARQQDPAASQQPVTALSISGQAQHIAII
jgi:hypothetical protein